TKVPNRTSRNSAVRDYRGASGNVARVELCTHLAYRKGEDGNPPPVHRRARALSQQMYPVVIRSAVHAATRCALAITALHPGFNLRNLAYEEGQKCGALHQREERTCSI